jgi:hypothetical protein
MKDHVIRACPADNRGVCPKQYDSSFALHFFLCTVIHVYESKHFILDILCPGLSKPLGTIGRRHTPADGEEMTQIT